MPFQTKVSLKMHFFYSDQSNIRDIQGLLYSIYKVWTKLPSAQKLPNLPLQRVCILARKVVLMKESCGISGNGLEVGAPKMANLRMTTGKSWEVIESSGTHGWFLGRGMHG